MGNYFKLKIGDTVVKKRYRKICDAMSDAGEEFQKNPELEGAEIYEVEYRLALRVTNKNRKK